MDWTDTNFPADQVDRVNASEIAHVEKNTAFIIRMQNMRPPFDNLNARKAFANAFNYSGFINDILGGYATRDGMPMPETLWGCPKDAVCHAARVAAVAGRAVRFDLPSRHERPGHAGSRRWLM